MVNAFVAGTVLAPSSHPPAMEAPPDDADTEPRIERVPTGVQVPVDLQPHPTVAVPRPFDPGAAYAAMARLDLTACKEAGMAPGYVHVDLELQPDGSTTGVSVRVPAATDGARGCIMQAFAGVRVAPFDGEQPVHVQRDVFVR